MTLQRVIKMITNPVLSTPINRISKYLESEIIRESLENTTVVRWEDKNKEASNQKGKHGIVFGQIGNDKLKMKAYTVLELETIFEEEIPLVDNVEDATFEHFSSFTSEFSAQLVEENDQLKKFLLYSLIGKDDRSQITKQMLIDKVFSLYSEKIFSMRDVLKYANLNISEFYTILNEKKIPYQYEDDFQVDDKDIEDWL